VIERGEADVIEPLTYDRANPFQRFIRRFAATGPGSWFFSRVQHHIDRPVHRLTNGRHTLASMLSGLPVVMLTTTGARSGKLRTSPVLGLPSPDGLVVIASNYGQRHHPAWYHNLRANPDGEVTVDGVARPFRASVAEGEKRERIWLQALKVYPGWSRYERRAAHRAIAVFVLDQR
jgi:deazaflavin-dependent oxidoreductase (nitroreductase family)